MHVILLIVLLDLGGAEDVVSEICLGIAGFIP
jgi:hypothetical protein